MTKQDDELREHNKYDALVTQALMEQHSDDWDMETIREAALIATNTILKIIPVMYTRKELEDYAKEQTGQAKQAITSLIKELVAEAKPGTWVDPEDTDDLEWQGYVRGVSDFEQNLLKALEEKKYA
jgi:hypothetical protein